MKLISKEKAKRNNVLEASEKSSIFAKMVATRISTGPTEDYWCHMDNVYASKRVGIYSCLNKENFNVYVLQIFFLIYFA